MTRLKDLYEYLDYLDNCSDGQFLKFVDAMKKRGYEFVSQYVHDYDYPYVTHCKDCKRYREYTYLGTQKVYVCERDRKKRIFDMNADDFCSRGERKDDDTDKR